MTASLKEYCEKFTPSAASFCKDVESWEGVLKDLFSPDDTCPKSTRYVDLRDGKLEVSASDTDANCNSTWGRRFDPTTSVNPVLIPGVQACMRNVSFISKVPADSPLYPDAQAGALNFTLTLGTAFGGKVFRWNGPYNGNGGNLNGQYVAPSSCDNFWLFEKTPTSPPTISPSSNMGDLAWAYSVVGTVVFLGLFLLVYRNVTARSKAQEDLSKQASNLRIAHQEEMGNPVIQ